MGRDDYRRRKRKAKVRRESAVSTGTHHDGEAVEAVEEPIEVHEPAAAFDHDVADADSSDAADHMTYASANGSHGLLATFGWLSLFGGIGLAGWGVTQSGAAASGSITGTAFFTGLGAASLFVLGCVCLLARRVLRRLDDVHGMVGHEIQSMMTISERTHSMFDGLSGFQERLEAIQSDRMAATLNQIRYEVSSLHEKVHRELFPTSEMQPILAEMTGSVGRVLEILDKNGKGEVEHLQQIDEGFASLRTRIESLESNLAELVTSEDSSAASAASADLEQFCSNMQDAIQRLNPGFESLQSAVESNSSTADRTMQAITELVGRLESEIHDLDEKANRILDMSHSVQEAALATPVATPAAAPVPAAAPAAGSHGSDSGLSPDHAKALEAAAAAAESTEVENDPKRNSTFLSAVERLKGLRGD